MREGGREKDKGREGGRGKDRERQRGGRGKSVPELNEMSLELLYPELAHLHLGAYAGHQALGLQAKGLGLRVSAHVCVRV